MSNFYIGLDLEVYKFSASNGFDSASRSIPLSMRVGYAANCVASVAITMVSHDVDYYISLDGDVMLSY